MLALIAAGAARAQQFSAHAPLVYEVKSSNQRLEMIVHTSRILTLDKRIPQAQVNNPDVADIKPLSAHQIQVIAKKPGVTQVNLWDEQGNISAVDVIVFGDARELEEAIRYLFPKSTVRVFPLANSVLLTGHVDNPQHVQRIVEIAEDYHPKVINNISVGGVQQVLLKVKVMEVSRTKLRSLGFDFAHFTNGDFVVSGAAGLISAFANGTVTSSPGANLEFGIIDGNSQFFGVLEAMRQDNLAKILAEPNLVTVSGRPAFFNVGGEFPIIVPQSLGTVSIEYKKFGTQVDFVPIVLANGSIRLEIRPRVSEIDSARSISISGVTVPGLTVREADTGVEMKAGQTLAIAGLVQERTETEARGFPWLSELPYIGAVFRRDQDVKNEIELLILVQPQLVAALDEHEIPPGGPGLATTRPSDHELFLKRYMEVPRCCLDGTCPQCRSTGYTPGALGGPGSPAEVLPPGARTVPLPNPPGAAGAPPGPRTSDPRPSGPSAGPASAPTSGPAIVVPQAAAPPSRHDPRPRYQPTAGPVSESQQSLPGFIGPTGYDVRK
jgi:pilus assembly protein CpaC